MPSYLSDLSRLAMTAALCLTLGGALTACESMPRLQEDTEVAQNRLVKKDSYAVAHITARQTDQALINTIATHYKTNAKGPLYIAMTYDPLQEATERKHISDHAHSLAKRLNDAGISDTRISIHPAVNAGHNAVIGYETAIVVSSAECAGKTMPGYDSDTRITMDGYRLGCTVESLTAMQVANQQDLEGRAGLGGVNDARRATNAIDAMYRTGETRDYLPGFIISELGGSGE